MKEINQIAALASKDFLALKLDPDGPVAHAVDATVQSPTCLLGAVAPAATQFLRRTP